MATRKYTACPHCCPSAPVPWDRVGGLWRCANCGTTRPVGTKKAPRLVDGPLGVQMTVEQGEALQRLLEASRASGYEPTVTHTAQTAKLLVVGLRESSLGSERFSLVFVGLRGKVTKELISG